MTELCGKHPDIREGLLRALADSAVQKYLVPHGGHEIFISALTGKKKASPSGGIRGGGGGAELAQVVPILEADPDAPIDTGRKASSHSHLTRSLATPLPLLGAGRVTPTGRSVFRAFVP